MKKVAFFGHSSIFYKERVKERLISVLLELISQGYDIFLIGCHGDFDNIALTSCLECRNKINKSININIVLTSLTFMNKRKDGYSFVDFYKDKNCQLLFYEIEQVYFKNKITYSNRKMVDNCDLVVCYVDATKYKSGAKTAVNYALRQNKRVLNLFLEEDKKVDLSSFKNYFDKQ